MGAGFLWGDEDSLNLDSGGACVTLWVKKR